MNTKSKAIVSTITPSARNNGKLIKIKRRTRQITFNSNIRPMMKGGHLNHCDTTQQLGLQNRESA